MVIRTAGRGRYEGQQFWGCSTYPKCRAVVDIKGQQIAGQSGEVMQENSAGASAQARYERGRQEHAARIRRGWPVLVGLILIMMLGTYLVAQAYVGQAWAGAIAAILGSVTMLGITRTEWLDSWRIGAEGERKTASYLAGLEQAGFIVRHDRRVPGYGGNVDHIAVGPTGVWVIETKSYRGGVDVYGDRKVVRGGESRLSAAQIEALAAELDKLFRPNVRPAG